MQKVDNPDLNELELQIDTLLRGINQLKHENNALRDQLSHSEHDKKHLHEKNQRAASKVKTLISHLKEKWHEP